MAVPDYQSLMLPLLQFASDGKDHRLRDVVDGLAIQLRLTDAERAEMLPSGKQTRFANRVGWAQTYLKKAALLEASGRSMFHITPRGSDVLRSKPRTINDAYLTRYPEYVAFKKNSSTSEVQAEPKVTSADTPEERLESTFQSLQNKLAIELLEHVKQSSPSHFEQLVVDLLVTMGYGGSRKEAGQAVGKSGDGGIDGIIKEDRLGLDSICIQAKKWEGTVGRPVVQAFAGSLEGAKARKGVLITTSKFSHEAEEYVKHIEKKIILVDGDNLVRLMIEHGIGVAAVSTYSLKRVDLDYFEVDDASTVT